MVDFAQTVNAPQAPSYSAPLVDFSPIGNYANDYFKGTQNKQTLDQQRAFPNGLPRDAQGNVDTNAIVNTAAKIGGLPMVQGLLPFLMAQGGGQSPDPYPVGGNPQGGTPSAGTPSSAPAANEKGAFDFFVAKGYTPEQASGIVGNLVAESKLNPSAVGDRGASVGVAQWQGPRRVALANFARENGLNPSDPNTQYEFLHHELQTSEGGAGAKLAASTDVKGATDAMMAFERPKGYTADNPQGGMNYGGRLANATRVNGAYGLRSTPGQPAGGQVADASGQATPGGPPVAPPTQVAQAQPVQAPQAPTMPAAGNVPPQAQALTNAAARAFNEAEKIGKFDPKRADALIARGKVLATQAEEIIKASQPTPEMRNAGASGSQNPAEFETEKAIAAKAGGAIGETIGETIGAGRSAQKRIQSLATIGDALKRGGGNITTGPFAETVLRGKQALSSALGIDMEGTPEAEVAQKMGFQLATQAVKEISNRPTQMEFQRALQNNPGLLLSQKGSHAMIDLLTQSSRQDVELAKLASRRENWKNWQEVQDKFYRDNPLRSPFDPKRALGPEDVKILEQSASAAPAATASVAKPGNQAAPIAVTSKAQRDALPSGTQYTAPDGSIRIKP